MPDSNLDKQKTLSSSIPLHIVTITGRESLVFMPKTILLDKPVLMDIIDRVLYMEAIVPAFQDNHLMMVWKEKPISIKIISLLNLVWCTLQSQPNYQIQRINLVHIIPAQKAHLYQAKVQ